MSYSEASAQLAAESSIAVLAIANPEGTELELLMLKPHKLPDSELLQLRGRWHGRNLRTVGVLGLVGMTPKCALKEPLEPEQIDALATAFLAYIRVLFAPAAPTDDSVEFCERLFALPDTRPN